MSGQKFLLSSPSKRHQLNYLNPEFIGIAKQLGKSHLTRKIAQSERKTVSNRVSYLNKEQILAEKVLNRKQKELETLMNTIARKEADEEEREARRRAREHMIAEQREMNMRKRNEHQQKLREAFLCLYDEHQQNFKNMRSTFSKHQSMLKTMQRETMRQNQEKVIRRSMARQESRKRIGSYFRQKNDLSTSRYKQKIRQQNDEAHRSLQEKQMLSSMEIQLKEKLQNHSAKINELSHSIRKVAYQSKNVASNKSMNWSSLSKNYRTIFTKDESQMEGDSKLDKLLQKQLSLNEQQIIKL